MADDRALVKNAADPEQIKRAARKEKDREVAFRASLGVVLSTAEGRYVFAELLERAGIYATVYDSSGSTMYFKEGRRNFGLELRAELERTSEALVEAMDHERRVRKQRDDRATDAHHLQRGDDAGKQWGRDEGGNR